MIVFLSNTISSYCTMQVINKMGKNKKTKVSQNSSIIQSKNSSDMCNGI